MSHATLWTGKLTPSTSYLIYTTGTSTPATIYTSAARAGSAGSFVTNAVGFASFFVNAGAYDLVAAPTPGAPSEPRTTISVPTSPLDDTVVASGVTFTQTYATADTTVPAVTAVPVVQTSASVATTASTQTTPFGYASGAQADAVTAQLDALVVDVAALIVQLTAAQADTLENRKLVNGVIDALQAAALAG